ncbi:hypothetical protein [Clostridium sp. E02]|uniref:hypothetical protein n=1 Tax=Clostridium sp. E02 TaxID=2487134 RepID=UPI000F543A9B|nr:hypothetical protein [Clostridium sp. E02]
MMKNEFEDLVQHSVSDEEYSTIEYVYTWYPTISEIKGKEQIAKLYTDFGMPLIEDMVERAGKMEKLDGDLRRAQAQLTAIQDRIKMLRGEDS